MRRRDFIAVVGAAAVWPVASRAQQRERVKRIGMLMPGSSESDPAVQSWLAAFVQELTRLGWTEGRNLRIDQRWPGIDIDQMRTLAAELVELKPDAILSRKDSEIARLIIRAAFRLTTSSNFVGY